MKVTVEIPESLSSSIRGSGTDPARAVLEGFAVEAYRSGRLSRAEVGTLLHHSDHWQTETFLSDRHAWPAPTAQEVMSDLDNLRELSQS